MRIMVSIFHMITGNPIRVSSAALSLLASFALLLAHSPAANVANRQNATHTILRKSLRDMFRVWPTNCN